MQHHFSTELQHTLNHLHCPACEATRLELNRTTEMKHLKFREAAELVLADERKYLQTENALRVFEGKRKSLRVGRRTYRDHVDFERRLTRFFGQIPLEAIHEGHWHEYQKQRLETAGSDLINHETSFLARVLERAGLWKTLKPKCPRLQVAKSAAGKALTPEIEHAILVAAASRPRWQPFYFAALLMINTTANQGEIVHLRIKDLEMKLRVIMIREGGGPLKLQSDGSFRHATKTPDREREIAMTDTIFWVCKQLLNRYHRICRRLKIEPSPDHYLFPGRARGRQLDPARHVESFKKAWAGICSQARVSGIRIEDFRHHASTKLQEDPLIAPGVIEHIMGHSPDSSTKKHYRDIRFQAQLQALQRIEVKPVPRPVESVDNLVQFQRDQAVTGVKKTS